MSKLTKEEEMQLIEGCKKGRRRDQHKLFKTYYGQLFAVCMRYASCHDEAQDLVNEGFLKIFSGLDQYEASGSFEAWMKTVTVHAALDYLRKHHHSEEIPDSDGITDDVLDTYGENEALSKLSTDEIMELIQKLPPMSRSVFNLYVFEDLSHADIAKQLNIKEGTSHWHLNFARTKLKEWIMGE